LLEILSQPKSGFFGSRLISEIERSGHQHYSELVVLVAYAKQSGVLRIKPTLQEFIAKGGTVRVSVGVGQANTTYEALTELYGLGLSLFVYHDSNLGQTFHPKMYLLAKPGEHALVSIGSSNLTAGGHYTNYELNVLTSLDLTKPADKDKLETLHKAIGQYMDPGNPCCKAATPALLEKLKDEGYVITEAGAKLAFKASAKKSAKTKLFGTMALPAKAPHPGGKKKSVAKLPPLALTPELFWKRLSNYDVSLKSSPGQIQIPIGHLKKFPPLSSPKVTKKGATQSETFLDVVFAEKGKKDILVQNARAILYEPAPTHKRSNQELRFTFHDRSILKRLAAQDILVFQRTKGAGTWFRVEHLKLADTSMFTGKTGTTLP
jgi:HKD family nuclease